MAQGHSITWADHEHLEISSRDRLPSYSLPCSWRPSRAATRLSARLSCGACLCHLRAERHCQHPRALTFLLSQVAGAMEPIIYAAANHFRSSHSFVHQPIIFAAATESIAQQPIICAAASHLRSSQSFAHQRINCAADNH